MRNHRSEIQTRHKHLLHLVPRLPHLAAIDTLDSESLENNLAPVYRSGRRQYAQLCNLRAVVHVRHHVAESHRRPRHLQTHIKTTYTQALHSLSHSLALRSIDRTSGTHFLGYIQTIVTKVSNHNILRTGKLSDSRSHSANQTSTRD